MERSKMSTNQEGSELRTIKEDTEMQWDEFSTEHSGKSQLEVVPHNLRNKIQWILKVSWEIIRLDRLERLLTGHLVDASVQKDWFRFPLAMQDLLGQTWKIMGADRFSSWLDDFMEERFRLVIAMVEYENKMIDLMRALQFFPSNPACAEMATKLRETREKLEEKLGEFLNLS